jgi:hypothetical protein
VLGFAVTSEASPTAALRATVFVPRRSGERDHTGLPRSMKGFHFQSTVSPGWSLPIESCSPHRQARLMVCAFGASSAVMRWAARPQHRRARRGSPPTTS